MPFWIGTTKTIVLLRPYGRIFFLSLLFTTTFSSFYSYSQEKQEKPTAAVIDLSAEQGVTASVSRILSDSLRASLYKIGTYRLLSRENMEDILKEQKTMLSGCTSQECVVEVGKLLSVQKMFSGTIGKVGATYVVTLKLFSVETGEIEKIEEEECAKCEEDSLLVSIRNIAKKVCGLPSETIVSPSQQIPNVGVGFIQPAPEKKEISIDLGKGVKMEMVLIPPGEFLMGSPASEEGRGNDEIQHTVRITKSFYLGKYEVTQEQWEAIMGNNPSYFKGARNPVEMVSWNDCQEFLGRLNQLISGGGFRLPFEAEWEYACRAGTTTAFHYGDSLSLDQANFYKGLFRKNRKETTPVGSFSPNAFGLYDMHGNVWEWCSDWYGEYPTALQIDPEGPPTGSYRVMRGGAWCYSAFCCRSADRVNCGPAVRQRDFGFRCVSSP
ncbi:MAG: SUMF1/EgtB/PvdO family nonheme iron enzyme [Candidatus Omnitrophota bacterium]